MRIKLDDGREFPTADGVTPLSWPLGSHYTWAEQAKGYPAIKAVLVEMSDAEIERERGETVKASFDKLFGHANRDMLALLDAEIERRIKHA